MPLQPIPANLKISWPAAKLSLLNQEVEERGGEKPSRADLRAALGLRTEQALTRYFGQGVNNEAGARLPDHHIVLFVKFYRDLAIPELQREWLYLSLPEFAAALLRERRPRKGDGGVTPDPTSEQAVAQLIDAVAAGHDAKLGERWRYTSPYRGLSAMEEKDSDYFFGREREIVEVLSVLAAEPARLPVLLGNSGVGKSSLAQAGVIAALRRQAWPEHAGAGPWPAAFKESRRWCFLTPLTPGAEPIKGLVEAFLGKWLFDSGSVHIRERNEWVELLLDDNKKTNLSDLLDATERQLGQPKPPAFFLYIDQGEQLYVGGEEHQRQRFSKLLAQAVADPRLVALMSMRSDFLGALQKDDELFAVHRKIDVPPLRKAELSRVIREPAQQLSARFESDDLVDVIARRTLEDSAKDVGALPLLSYTLDDMWKEMVRRGDGVLRLSAATFELDRVLAERANSFLARTPTAENMLRKVLTLKLATVGEEGTPTLRRAARSEFTGEEWWLVSKLADDPNRLVVTATPEGGETYAEVAHEAIFRRWDRLRDWIAAEREFLAWRSGLEAVRRAWQAAPDASKSDALLMGLPLDQAQSWLGNRAEDISPVDREFILLSRKAAERRKLRARALVAGGFAVALLAAGAVKIMVVIITALVPIVAEARKYRPHAKTPATLAALAPLMTFQDCLEGSMDCPLMVVLPVGKFNMGWPPGERGAADLDEQPQHPVSIRRFAVSRYDITFDEWQACVDAGGCKSNPEPSDGGWGKGRRPVINVSWSDAQEYVKWLSEMTGQYYRLLSEAEWEYAARANTTTAYYWGDEIGSNNANCKGCGSKWDNLLTAPVGSFNPNDFTLHDMAGNVLQWVEDCKHDNYVGAPDNGSPWITDENCPFRILRGGDFGALPLVLRSAERGWDPPNRRLDRAGFRVARAL